MGALTYMRIAECFFLISVPLKTTIGITYGSLNGVHAKVISWTHACNLSIFGNYMITKYYLYI